MKLPTAVGSGVPGFGRAPDHSASIRQGFESLGRGLSDVADVVERIEIDRLDEQQQQVSHEYEILKLNHEADHYSRTEYAADDRVLDGLDVKRTEMQIIDGQLQEVPREYIPADEVWPQLMERYQRDLIQAQMSKIESPKRRAAFERVAHEQSKADMVRAAARTAELQYKRQVEERDQQIASLRIIGTPEAHAKISEVINGIKDPNERAERQEWWSQTKVIDQNTARITEAVRDRDVNALEEGWNEYLDYASGKKDYTGPLDQEQLETQAHRFYKHMNQVKTLNGADTAMMKADWLFQSQNVRKQLDAGRPIPDDYEGVVAQGQFMMAADPSETVRAEQLRLQLSADSTTLFLDELSTVGQDGKTIADVRQDLQSNLYNSNMDSYTGRVIQGALDRVEIFTSAMDSDPMQALMDYELAVNEAFPIEDVDFSSPEAMMKTLSQREASFEYYRNIYGYNGHILSKNERADFMDILTRDDMTNDMRMDMMLSTTLSLRNRQEQFWSPFLTDTEYGQWAAVGMMLKDGIELNNLPGARNIARHVLNGFEQRKLDPTIVQDYAYIREAVRSEFGNTYNGLPGVRDAYMNMAEAYAISTMPRNESILGKRHALQALDAVTNGMIENGPNKFLTPAAGVTQKLFTEFTKEIGPKYFPDTIHGWSATEIADGLRDGELYLQPTGRIRNEFYIMDRNGSGLMDRTTGRLYRTAYTSDTNVKRDPDDE